MLIPTELKAFEVTNATTSVDAPAVPVEKVPLTTLGELPAKTGVETQLVPVSQALALVLLQVRMLWAVAGTAKQAQTTHAAAINTVLRHVCERMKSLPVDDTATSLTCKYGAIPRLGFIFFGAKPRAPLVLQAGAIHRESDTP